MDQDMISTVDVHKILTSVPDYIQKVQCDCNRSTESFKCAVLSCCNFFHSFASRDQYPYKFHNFPLDKNLRSTWKAKCGLRKSTNVSNLKVCSDHFGLNDYRRDYKREFTDPKFQRTLLVNAVPKHKIVLDKHFNPGDSDSETEERTEPMQDGIPETQRTQNVAIILNESLKKQHQELLQEKRRISAKISECEKKMNSVLTDLGQVNEIRQGYDPGDVLHKVFSDSQINLLLGKRRVKWTDDDLAKAFTLRQMAGKKCYLYLKTMLNMPLPSLGCVQKWAASSRHNS